MSKRQAHRMSRHEVAATSTEIVQAPSSANQVQAFSFGDPEPVLDRRQLIDMIQVYRNSRWYEPPIPMEGLARAFRASPHHSSAIQLKCNQLASRFVATPLLSKSDFKACVLDYLVFGNFYLERRDNVVGRPLRLAHALAKYTRRGVDDGTFWFVPGIAIESEFKPGSVFQGRAPDINQEIYGIPEYLSALQSALLNESATLFRRRYYLNGSHAGFIMYATGDFAEGDVDRLREALKRSKGPGNFRNLFVHAPNGKENGIKLLPIAEVGAKDEFLGIKNTTRDDVLAAHRVPPQLLGIVPANAGGFGSVTDALAAFQELEIWPLEDVFLEVNDWIGAKAVGFQPRPAANDA